MSKRKSYTAEEKIKILREILEEGKPISQVVDKYELHPNNIFNWRKQLFDDVFYGRTENRLAERKEKLHTAFIKRQEYWQSMNAAS